MKCFRCVVALAVALATAILASAPGQRCEAAEGSSDYIVTKASGLYEAPPSNATVVTFGSPGYSSFVDLPFTFLYFGVTFDRVLFTQYGFVQFGASAATANATSYKLDDQAAVPPGVCGPLWANLVPNALGARASYHVAGTAPNRRIVFSWVDHGNIDSSTSRVSFQVKLYEGSQRIEFAYLPDGSPSTFTKFSYTCGLDAPGSDSRWVAAVSASQITSFPASDFQLDPRLVDVTAHLVYQRRSVTESGLTAAAEAPLPFAAVEVRSGSSVVARGFADAAGDLSMKTAIPPGSPAPTIHVLTSSAGVTVLDPDAAKPAPWEIHLLTTGGIFSNVDLGTLRIDATSDVSGTVQRAANIAAAAERLRDWASARVTETIAPLDVWFSATSAAATGYTQPQGATPGHLRVAGPSAANPDMWDDAVIQRAYGRHVLGSIAAFPLSSKPYDQRFDASTNDQNAFAEGFGCYAAAVLSERPALLDATSDTTSTAIDLEDPTLTAAKSESVTGWVAAALWDLADGTGEAHDLVDGTTGDAVADPLRALAQVSGPPTAAGFVDAWRTEIGDPLGVSRDFVFHGLLADDHLELNDGADEAADLGAIPARRTGLQMNVGNEDWFLVTVPAASAGIFCEMDFERSLNQAGIRMEVFDSADQLVAAKTDTSFSPVVLQTGALAAGDYRVRLRHLQGVRVPSYTFQAAEKLKVGAGLVPPWTAGHLISQPLSIEGGHPPYLFATSPAGGNGSGIGFSTATLRATGTPPAAGVWEFTLVVRDSGTPVHEVSSLQQIVVNAPLSFALRGFLPFPADRAFDTPFTVTGGTPPLQFRLDEGALPEGAALSDDDLRVTGAGVLPASARVRVTGTDVARSTMSEDATAVACVRLEGRSTAAELAEGDAACGFWFDAVSGSVVDVTVKTAKGAPRRALSVTVFGPGGAVVPAKLRKGAGRASATAIRCVETGRHFVVLSSASGEATTLLAGHRIRPPTRVTGRVKQFGDTSVADLRFGALAGAELTFSARVGKKSRMTLDVLAVLAPDGSSRPLSEIVTEKGTVATVRTPLDVSGTWTIRIGGVGGDASTLVWSAKLREPKGVAYEEE